MRKNKVLNLFWGLLSPKTLSRNAYQNPKVTIVLTLCLLGLAFMGISRIRVELDIYQLKDTEFQSTLRLGDMRSVFSDFNSLNFFIEWKQPPSNSQLCLLRSKLQFLSNEILYTLRASTVFDLKQVDSRGDFVSYHSSLGDPCDAQEAALWPKVVALRRDFPSAIVKASEKYLYIHIGLIESPKFENAQSKYLMATEQWYSALKGLENPLQMKVKLTGPSAFRFHFQKALKHDSIINLLFIPFVFLFMRLAFGSWRSGAIFLATAMSTVLVVVGFMGFCNFPIDILFNSLLLLTVIASASDFIFLTYQMRNRTIIDSILQNATPSFFTTLTTAIGFASLGAAKFDIINRFGYVAAFGSLMEWYFIFIVLPAFVALVPSMKSWYLASKTNWVRSILDKLVLVRFPILITIMFVCLTFGSFYYINKLNFYDDPVSHFPDNHTLSSDMKSIQSDLGWIGQLYLLFDSGMAQEAVDQCFARIEQEPLFSGIENPYAIRQHFLKGLNDVRADAIWRQLKNASFFKSYFSAQKIRGQVFLRELNSRSIQKAADLIKTLCPEAEITGQSDVFLEISNNVISTLWESFLLSVALVLLVVYLIIYFDRSRNYGSILLSIAVGPLVCISLLGFFQVSINIMTCIFLSVLVGMTGDNAIQFIFSRTDTIDSGINEKAGASILFSVFLALGSLILTFQQLVPVRTLGLLFAMGSILSLIGDLWILKSLLAFTENLFSLFRRKRQNLS